MRLVSLVLRVLSPAQFLSVFSRKSEIVDYTSLVLDTETLINACDGIRF